MTSAAEPFRCRVHLRGRVRMREQCRRSGRAGPHVATSSRLQRPDL